VAAARPKRIRLAFCRAGPTMLPRGQAKGPP